MHKSTSSIISANKPRFTSTHSASTTTVAAVLSLCLSALAQLLNSTRRSSGKVYCATDRHAYVSSVGSARTCTIFKGQLDIDLALHIKI
eukprot:1089383-Amphidinium_carterae.1